MQKMILFSLSVTNVVTVVYMQSRYCVKAQQTRTLLLISGLCYHLVKVDQRSLNILCWSLIPAAMY